MDSERAPGFRIHIIRLPAGLSLASKAGCAILRKSLRDGLLYWFK